MSARLIPFYGYDGACLEHITIKRAQRPEGDGTGKIVRHKKGDVNRVILYRPPG